MVGGVNERRKSTHSVDREQRGRRMKPVAGDKGPFSWELMYHQDPWTHKADKRLKRTKDPSLSGCVIVLSCQMRVKGTTDSSRRRT